MEQTIAIEVKNLCKSFQKGRSFQSLAINRINMTVEAGQIVSIMGPSGCGKSVLMKMLGGILVPTEGEIILEGTPYTHGIPKAAQKKIGFVFQSFNLIPRTSALKNVELPMVYGKVAADKRRARALELLESVGLGERYEHMPNELSGGQRQRVAIARALANDPPIILADEPTGNLDSRSSVEIMEIFTQLNREKGNTVIIVTHEPDIAEFTDRVVVFKDGQIIEDKLTEKGRSSGKEVYKCFL